MPYLKQLKQKNYILGSEEEYLNLIARMEFFFIENLHFFVDYSYNNSVDSSLLKRSLDKSNLKKLFCSINNFSEKAKNFISQNLIGVLEGFVMGNPIEDLGDENGTHYFLSKPFGSDTEFIYFECLLFILNERGHSSTSSEYWKSFVTVSASSFHKDIVSLRSSYQSKTFVEAYDLAKEFINRTHISFFKNYIDYIFYNGKLREGNKGFISSSIIGITNLEKLSVLEEDDFRKKLESIVIMFGEKEFCLSKNDALIKLKDSGWTYSETLTPIYKFLEKGKSNITKSDISDIITTLEARHYYSERLPHYAFAYKALSSLEDNGFLDDIFLSTEGKPMHIRASMYSAYIAKGLGDKKFFRKMRSDTSGYCSAFALRSLIENRSKYEGSYLECLSQFNDTKHHIVMEILERLSPKENLVGLLGNSLSNKEVIFSIINK